MGFRPLHHRGQRRAIGRRAALAFVVLAAAAPRAQAQGETWTVRGVAVDVGGSDAVTARDRALADGTRQAWDQLLTRLVTPERAASLRTLPIEEIEQLTASVEIEDEAVAPTRYRASMTVVFDARRVRTKLAEATGGAGGGGPVAAIASFRGVRQWADLQRRLEASVAIARVDLKALRASEADLQLLLTADPANAAEALAAGGIRLEADPAGGPFRVRLAAP
jgi:hypothetical protein